MSHFIYFYFSKFINFFLIFKFNFLLICHWTFIKNKHVTSVPKLKLTETLQKYAIGYLQSVRYYKRFSKKSSAWRPNGVIHTLKIWYYPTWYLEIVRFASKPVVLGIPNVATHTNIYQWCFVVTQILHTSCLCAEIPGCFGVVLGRLSIWYNVHMERCLLLFKCSRLPSYIISGVFHRKVSYPPFL